MAGAAALGALILLYATFASRLARWWISMPMVFVAAGVLLGPNGTGTFTPSPEAEGFRELTEITLALLLFADASTLQFRQMRHDAVLPLRLLTIGLLLTIAWAGCWPWASCRARVWRWRPCSAPSWHQPTLRSGSPSSTTRRCRSESGVRSTSKAA